VEPILQRQADIVVGDRDPTSAAHFSASKRLLQGVGTWVVQQLSNTAVPDAASGFRAVSREAALRLNVVTGYSYTLETLIQAGAQRFAVSSVPIEARPTPRRSRLSRSTLDYVQRSMVTIVRAYAMYQPVRVFVALSVLLVVPGLFGAARFLWFYLNGAGSGHIQSLVLSGVLLVIGFQVGLIGLVADLIAANRRLVEESLYRLRRLDVGEGSPASPTDRRQDVAAPNLDHPRSVFHV
jgi:hypothetical protein